MFFESQSATLELWWSHDIQYLHHLHLTGYQTDHIFYQAR